jgi:hypothetical protein
MAGTMPETKDILVGNANPDSGKLQISISSSKSQTTGKEESRNFKPPNDPVLTFSSFRPFPPCLERGA